MQVKILMSLAGSNFSYSKGDTCEVEDAEAQNWIDAGWAEKASGKEAKAKASKETNIETATEK